MMNAEVEAKLRRTGWYPGRRLDEAKLTELLKMGVQEFGCHIFPEVIRILREYGDLVITTRHFSLEDSRFQGEKYDWIWWEWALNEVLFPIAVDISTQWTYAVSPRGKIYGSDGAAITFFGDSIEEFVSGILGGGEAVRWTEIVPTHMTTEVDLELERMCAVIYAEDEAWRL